MLCIRPTNIVHPTYRRVQPTKREECKRPTVGRIHLIFFDDVCIRPTVHRTNSSLKLLKKNHVRVGPKYRWADVIQSNYLKTDKNGGNMMMGELTRIQWKSREWRENDDGRTKENYDGRTKENYDGRTKGWRKSDENGGGMIMGELTRMERKWRE